MGFFFFFIALSSFVWPESGMQKVQTGGSFYITNECENQERGSESIYLSEEQLQEMMKEGNLLLEAGQKITLSLSFFSTSKKSGLFLVAGEGVIFEEGALLSLEEGAFHVVSPAHFFMKKDSAILTKGGEIVIHSPSLLVASFLDAGGGKISISGKGGNGQPSGVVIGGRTKICTKGEGEIGIVGIGGNRVEENHGILIDGEATLSCEEGRLSLFGQGGGNGWSQKNDGIYLRYAHLHVAGRGDILLEGIGGLGEDRNRGIVLSDRALLEANQGKITLTGTGRGCGKENQGIYLEKGARLLTSQGGSIQLRGAGGNGQRKNVGVLLRDPTTALVTQKGEIHLIGFGSGEGRNNPGIHLQNHAMVISLQGGSIYFEGIGGGLSSSGEREAFCNEGILIEEGRVFSKKKISFQGRGGKGSHANHGISIFGEKEALESETGEILLEGTRGEGDSCSLYRGESGFSLSLDRQEEEESGAHRSPSPE